jgi:hypothetical protein
MTDEQWLNSDEIPHLIDYVYRKASRRKLQLTAVAACRQLMHLLVDSRSRHAVELAEKFADGLTTPEELASAEEGAKAVVQAFQHERSQATGPVGALAMARTYAADAARHLIPPHSHPNGVLMSAYLAATWDPARRHPEQTQPAPATTLKVRVRQAALVQCVLADSLRTVAFDAAWRTQDVLALAEVIYEERAFDRMPILGDALEEAGCPDAAILGHCRENGPHARGCWVVDRILNKR